MLKGSFASQVLLVPVLLLAQVAFAQAPRFIEFDPPGSIYTVVFAINSSGSVAGYYEDANVSFHGFLREPNGTITTFDEPDAAQGQSLGTTPVALNDSGEIAGYYTPLAAPSSYQGFIRNSSGDFSSIGVPGLQTSQLLALNNSGQTAGCAASGDFCYLYGGTGEGFTETAPGVAPVTFLPDGAVTVTPEAMNTSGTVTGPYADSGGELHGFLLAPSGAISEFDLPVDHASSVGTYPRGINDSNVVVGWYFSPTFQTLGFIRQPNGKITSFNVPGEGNATYPVGINSVGTILGIYSNATGYHGFVRNSAGQIAIFDAPHASPRPGYGTQPVAINESGVIAGDYVDSTGEGHGFIRVP